MYSLLKQHGSIDDAIRNAKMLEGLYKDRLDFANQNPRTEVYKLVEELLTLS